MPVAKVYVPEGTLTPDQRRAIVKGIHEVIHTVAKRPPTLQTYVLISEIACANWSSAGTVYRPG